MYVIKKCSVICNVYDILAFINFFCNLLLQSSKLKLSTCAITLLTVHTTFKNLCIYYT